MSTLSVFQIKLMLDIIEKADAALTMVRILPPGATLNHHQWCQISEASSLGYVLETLLIASLQDVEIAETHMPVRETTE